MTSHLERRQAQAAEIEEEFERRRVKREPALLEPAEVGQWFDACFETYQERLKEARAALPPKPAKRPGPAAPAATLAIAQWEYDNVRICTKASADHALAASRWPAELEHLEPFFRRRLVLIDHAVEGWATALDAKAAALTAAKERAAAAMAPIERGRAIARNNLAAGRAKLVAALEKEIERHEKATAAIAAQAAIARTPIARQTAELERLAEEERHEAAVERFAAKAESIDAALANVA